MRSAQFHQLVIIFVVNQIIIIIIMQLPDNCNVQFLITLGSRGFTDFPN
jgi:hypothetical protein